MPKKIVSCGEKWDRPNDGEVIDIRPMFTRNPYHDRRLRGLRGTDTEVQVDILKTPNFDQSFAELLRQVAMSREATVYVMCSAGHYRSVFLAELLGKHFGIPVEHRDIDKQLRIRPTCRCLSPQYRKRSWSELTLHSDRQDTSCNGWKRMLDLVEHAAYDRRQEFAPFREMLWEERLQIVTLPLNIAKLTFVRHLDLYGSNLVRIPPEIGEMSALEEFTPYTSMRLHFFPYEITRCAKLKNSTVSTRALYGNYKYRPPFPRLPSISSEITPARCSLCGGSFTKSGPHQFWVSQWVASDVLPLLVHACSEECVRKLPKSAAGYVPEPHQGGLELQQPPLDECYR